MERLRADPELAGWFCELLDLQEADPTGYGGVRASELALRCYARLHPDDESAQRQVEREARQAALQTSAGWPSPD